MRFSDDVVTLSPAGLPMVGNLATGGIIGLTSEGARLCAALSEQEVFPAEVPQGCHELVGHLERGGYLGPAKREATRLDSTYLHVTQRCNLSCRFCYSEGDDRNRLADPPLASLCRAVGLLASLGCARLVISGGEPFLRDDLPELAGRARDAGIPEVVVLTNGLLVDEARVRALRGAVSCVAVAFDGASADAPAPLRGSQNYERLVRAVEVVRDAGIEARILPTLHAANLDDIPRYQRLAEKLGATLGFSLLTAPGDELGELRLTSEQLRRLGTRPPAGMRPAGDALDPSALPALCARSSCGAGRRTLSVAADGTVYPCHMLHVRELALGNAFEGSLGAPAGMPSVDDVEECSSCDVRYLCGGGCRARALMATGSLSGRDPYCELSRSHYTGLCEQLARRFRGEGVDDHAV